MLPDQRADDADRAGDDPEHRELNDEERERRRDRRAEAAEHRGRVEMPAQVARRGQRDRDRRQQHGDERREAEEPLGAFERLPHFRAQVAHRVHALSGLDAIGEPRTIIVDPSAAIASGDQQAPRRTIAGLQQIRRRHVAQIEQQLRPRREREPGNLGLLRNDRGDGERRVADGQPGADARADSIGEPRVDPCLARRGDALGRSALAGTRYRRA